jgi:hypothetical protein
MSSPIVWAASKSEVSNSRCTFNLVLDIDPVALVRGRGGDSGLLDQYVNDRPYAASSCLSVAMAKTLRTALSGRSDERQALADTSIPLQAVVTPLPVRGDPALVAELFAPLGYEIETEVCSSATEIVRAVARTLGSETSRPCAIDERA